MWILAVIKEDICVSSKCPHIRSYFTQGELHSLMQKITIGMLWKMVGTFKVQYTQCIINGLDHVQEKNNKLIHK